ncbi:GWxTD domain-containing protein [Pontibacter diazotrophicus]|uniref:GWxTD domain-containing protein n=1 Tax=Pontibacter diazotrophicus TaxID=1400979 RepID=A0A3D8LDR5_9BACT|nr:GWxTD domain-containing protein [Pontibacter diazotrophicus]RDV15092.1 GWxTD domain-containing protein [Pontibacter diazotrophicus]
MKYPHTLLLLLPLLAMGCGRFSSASLAPVEVERETPEITMQHSYYTSNDSLHLLFKFEDAKEVVDILQKATSYEYEIRTGGIEKDALIRGDSVDLPDRKITDIEGQLQVQLVLPAEVVQEPNVLHLRLWQFLAGPELMGTKFRLPLSSKMLQKDYLLIEASTGKPLLQNYATTGDKVLVRNYGGEAGVLKLQRFDADFMPAPPPMSLRSAGGPRTISAAEVQTIAPGDTVTLQEEGIYLFDPNTNYARSILVQPANYPQITRTKEMLQPLIYLTTSEEREALLNASDTKAAIDRFWLELAGNKAAARNLIQIFYSRVELANKLYSSHKAGWATDRGMIHIILGPPDGTNQVGSTITWTYRETETAPNIKFVFNKKENNFTENHYELVRRRGYGEIWYSTVAKWRAGRINM